MPVPGRRCPICLEQGQTVWVIPGKDCPNCGKPHVPKNESERLFILSDPSDEEESYFENTPTKTRRGESGVGSPLTLSSSTAEDSATVLQDPSFETPITSTYWIEDTPVSVSIQCICGFTSDSRHLVQCEKCGTWQHIACYYSKAKDVVETEIHECVTCDPRVIGPQIDALFPHVRRNDPSAISSAPFGRTDASSVGTGSRLGSMPTEITTAPTSDYDSVAGSVSVEQESLVRHPGKALTAAIDSKSLRLYHSNVEEVELKDHWYQTIPTLQACSQCRTRKILCVPSLPRCEPCEQGDLPCEFYHPLKGHHVGFPRNYVAHLKLMVHGLGQKSKEEDSGNLSPNIDEEESHHDENSAAVAILMKGKAPNERPTEAARIAIAGPNQAVADEEMSNSVAKLEVTGAVSSPNTPMHLPGQDLTLPQSPDVTRLHGITINYSADLVDQRMVETAVGSSKEEASSDTTSSSSSSFAVHGQREFLFVDAARPRSSVQGRRNARSFVMQKARRERPWSTSKHSARSNIPPELKKPIVVLNSWGNELPLRVDDFTTMDQVYDDHVKGGTVSLHPTKDLTAEAVTEDEGKAHDEKSDLTMHKNTPSEASAPSPLDHLSRPIVASATFGNVFGPQFTCLNEYCKARNMTEPTLKTVTAQFRPTNTWVATIVADGVQHYSRSWQGPVSRENAVEDAAFIALQQLYRKDSAQVDDVRRGYHHNTKDTTKESLPHDWSDLSSLSDMAPLMNKELAHKEARLESKSPSIRNVRLDGERVRHYIRVLEQRPDCVRCRHENLKCDKGRPNCNNCQRRGIICEGYWKSIRLHGTGPWNPNIKNKDQRCIDDTGKLLRAHQNSNSWFGAENIGSESDPNLDFRRWKDLGRSDTCVYATFHTAYLHHSRNFNDVADEIRCPKCFEVLSTRIPVPPPPHVQQSTTSGNPSTLRSLHQSSSLKSSSEGIPAANTSEKQKSTRLIELAQIDSIDGARQLGCVKCVCRFDDDTWHIVQCESCATFQHIACYYRHAKQIFEIHRCVNCSPRDLSPPSVPVYVSDNKDVMSKTGSALVTGTWKRVSDETWSVGKISAAMKASRERVITLTTRLKDRQGSQEPVSSTIARMESLSNVHACERCQIGKKRCDSRLPRCAPCEMTFSECVFFDPIADRKIPRDYIWNLQRSVRNLSRKLEVKEKMISFSDGSGLSLPYLHDLEAYEAELRLTSESSAALIPTSVALSQTNVSVVGSNDRQKPIAHEDRVPLNGLGSETLPSQIYRPKSSSSKLASIDEVPEESRISAPVVSAHFRGMLQDLRSKQPSKPMPSLELKEKTVVDMETGQTSLIEHAPPSAGTPQAEDGEDYSKLGREAIQRKYGSRSPEQIPVKSPLSTSAEGEDFDNYYIQCTCGNACVPHLLPQIPLSNEMDWKMIRSSLPEEWMWDIEYHTTHSIDGNEYGCWTCTPSEPEGPRNFPLTISLAPVVIPVEHQWPPVSGVHPPPDPRPSVLVDYANVLPLEVIRDIFLTFEGSIGFYLLINGLLQIIVPETFDREWASSHLPHRFGGLKISYINQTLEPTVTLSPSRTETMNPQGSQATQSSSKGSIFRPSRTSAASSQLLRINDFIDAKSKSSYKKERFAGRIGLKVAKHGDPSPYLVMSTHVITEAILAKSQLSEFLGRRDRFEKLDDDWNDHVEIWAGNERIGTIHQTFDQEAETYPTGFKHDMTLIKPNSPSNMNDITSPIQDLGWLSRSSWHTLRQQSSSVKLLPLTDSHRPAKTLKCSTPSQVLVVGEGIFLNQKAAQPTRDQDISTWKDLVSRAVLYRVYPDFDPPTGYSGIALYAEGVREDGTEGPGMVGFQSFVQRSGHVQNFEMEGGALDKRLKLGRVAFYGAFEVPDEVKRDYRIL